MATFGAFGLNGPQDVNFGGGSSVVPLGGGIPTLPIASAPTAAAISAYQSSGGSLGSSSSPVAGGNPAAASLGGPGGSSSGGLGFNLDTGKLVLGGIQAIGNIWAAWEANKLAKEQFKYTKDITETNLANQIAAYNTGLEDKVRGRASYEEGTATGMKRSDIGGYMESHKLTRDSATRKPMQ